MVNVSAHYSATACAHIAAACAHTAAVRAHIDCMCTHRYVHRLLHVHILLYVHTTVCAYFCTCYCMCTHRRDFWRRSGGRRVDLEGLVTCCIYISLPLSLSLSLSLSLAPLFLSLVLSKRCRLWSATPLWKSYYNEVYSVIYDPGSVPEVSIFSPRGIPQMHSISVISGKQGGRPKRRFDSGSG